jgi:hypothetical protein
MVKKDKKLNAPSVGGISANNDSLDLYDLFEEDDNQKSENSVTITKEKIRKGNGKGLFSKPIFVVPFVIALIACVVLGSVFLYFNYVKYPPEQKRVWEESRLYALTQYESCVNSFSLDTECYLMKELLYANSNPYREQFYKYVVNTVMYSADPVPKKNIYGKDYIDPTTDSIVLEESWLSEDEAVSLSYIDYSSIEFSAEKVRSLITESGLSASDVDYHNKLTDLFCQYICGLDVEKLPIAVHRRVPFTDAIDGGYCVSPKEDIYLDRLLFSSNELYACFERFAEEAARCLNIDLNISQDYTDWENSPEYGVTPAPTKYGKYSIQHNWCGSYYLMNERKEVILPGIGDGSKEHPAGVDTPVITYVLETDSNGNLTKLPIRVVLKEYGVSQEALDWFNNKDERNKGYDVRSRFQYCYFVFEVTNLSGSTLTVFDNATLCDNNANASGRAGMMYGVQSSVTLMPDETGIIETWGRSTELYLKYLIWGEDFGDATSPIWFRVLAGDLEDPSWNKGVYVER